MNLATAPSRAPQWNANVASGESARYARCVEVSRRVRWEIDADVIRGRQFDFDRTFLPAGLSLVERIDFLDEAERRLFSQVQGRTYAWMFGLCERFIGAKMLQASGRHWLGDQNALEALVTLLIDVGEERIARRIGVIWLALGDLIGRDASQAEKAVMIGTLREVINEPQGLMRLRIHPGSADMIDEAQRLNESLDGLRRRVMELSVIYDA